MSIPVNDINSHPTTKDYEKITYLMWKPLTIGSFIFVIISLTFVIFYIKLIVLNELYNKYRICDPLFYFYGKKDACRSFIKNTKIKALKEKTTIQNKTTIDISYVRTIIDNEPFENPNLTKLIIEETNNSNYFNFDIKETIDNNYLAMVEFIHSLKELFWASIFISIKQILTI